MILDRLPGWKWADLIPANGYGRCYGCHRPWWMRRGHDVYVTATGGIFALCEPCWDISTVGERLTAYKWVIEHQGKPSTEVGGRWRTCEANIRAEATS